MSALEQHIIINGQVKTIWGDGSVVESAILREMEDKDRTIARLVAMLSQSQLQLAEVKEELRLAWAIKPQAAGAATRSSEAGPLQSSQPPALVDPHPKPAAR